MRIILNLDGRAAAAARARARRRGVTLGEAVSELVLAGLEAEETPNDVVHSRGLVLLPSDADHVITHQMVAEALEDEYGCPPRCQCAARAPECSPSGTD